MNWGKWETSKVIKQCDGCNELINVDDTYLLAKFAMKDEGTNVSRLFAMNLCVACVDDFESTAQAIQDMNNNDTV